MKLQAKPAFPGIGEDRPVHVWHFTENADLHFERDMVVVTDDQNRGTTLAPWVLVLNLQEWSHVWTADEEA